MTSSSDRWADTEHSLALAGYGPDHLFTTLPEPRIHPEDYDENSRARALAIRLPALRGQDYRDAEWALRTFLRVQGTIDELLGTYGYPESPDDLALMEDDWRLDEIDYSKWDIDEDDEG